MFNYEFKLTFANASDARVFRGGLMPQGNDRQTTARVICKGRDIAEARREARKIALHEGASLQRGGQPVNLVGGYIVKARTRTTAATTTSTEVKP